MREGGVSSPRRVQFAVCTLQAARSGHENKLNYIERNGTGLEVAGLAGLDGIGFEFEEGGKPQMAASPSGGRGKERLAAGGSRCGANVQARVGQAASTCRIWIPEVVIKWSLNCAKGSASLASLAALAFQGL